MFGRIFAVAALVAMLAVVPAEAVGAQQACPEPAVGLTNGSFEEPHHDSRHAVVAEGDVPGWDTTASDGTIEMWGPDNAPINRGLEVPAVEGTQFVELNSNEPSTLYQDVVATPGQAMLWQVHHRARNSTDGFDEDTMRVAIGPPGNVVVQTPSGQSDPDIVDGEDEWGSRFGRYTVPAGQTVIRFAFGAVDTSTGDPSIGNFLDQIEFGTPACLTLTKTSSGGPLNVGDEIRYEITARNDGNSRALDTVLTDPIPAATSFVPGSLRIDGLPVTDQPGDDAGEVDPRQVTARLGAGASATAGGALTSTATATVSYAVRVVEYLPSVDNQATVDYVEGVGATNERAVSPVVTDLVIAPEPTPTPPDPTNPAPQASGPTLAATGPSIMAPAAVALALLLTGALLLVHRTRFRSRAKQPGRFGGR
ncbi:MAG: DUF11 domain-containing protein [Actinophytocola sp.]|uniref:DUF11 domain-containing protein n=1 Tax=Actinophytocola sp. TaxID=1872138 RepID=UPI003C762C02